MLKECSLQWFASFTGLTLRHVQRLAAEGVIKKKENGKLDTAESLSGYIKSLQSALRHGGGENGETARARSRYEIARANEKELEVAKLFDQVVLAEDVQEVWENAASNWRTKLLAIPAKIATRTQGMKDRH